ncbi:unnamed protein product [Ilex paraguariensis]|uniref:Uncharacterized protein n=1 Tax=Ilex paraguariensis TaxID=185542 RepID=A0ABC8QT41_9AQUA
MRLMGTSSDLRLCCRKFCNSRLPLSSLIAVINDLLDPTAQNLRVREDAQSLQSCKKYIIAELKSVGLIYASICSHGGTPSSLLCSFYWENPPVHLGKSEINRRTLIHTVNPDAENSFKKTVEVDILIDMLSDVNDKEVALECGDAHAKYMTGSLVYLLECSKDISVFSTPCLK